MRCTRELHVLRKLLAQSLDSLNHSDIFPGEKLEPLYAPIRHKLGNALLNWHPSDSSAKVILKPWQGVFREGHMEVFLRKHILPKLEMCLQEFPINPHQQTLGKSLNFFYV